MHAPPTSSSLTTYSKLPYGLKFIAYQPYLNDTAERQAWERIGEATYGPDFDFKVFGYNATSDTPSWGLQPATDMEEIVFPIMFIATLDDTLETFMEGLDGSPTLG